MRWGIILVALGIACYIVHTMLLNYFLRKNAPDVLEGIPRAPSQRPRRVLLVRGATPQWMTLLGLLRSRCCSLGSCSLPPHASSPYCAEAALQGTNL